MSLKGKKRTTDERGSLKNSKGGAASPAPAMRLALRLLQAVDAKVEMGQKLYTEDEQTKDKSELVLI